MYEKDAPHVDPAVFDLDVPVLGICYGLQEIAWLNKTEVGRGEKREYGPATLHVEDKECPLFANVDNSTVWMSHHDKVHNLSLIHIYALQLS